MMKVWTDLNTALFSSSFRLTEPKINRFSEIVSGMSKSENQYAYIFVCDICMFFIGNRLKKKPFACF
jgi:hypothetical protein